MYSIFKIDKKMLNFAIEIENFIFELLLSKEKNKYSNEVIKKLEYVLKNEDIEDIIETILKYSIDITKLTNFNYLGLRSIFNNYTNIYKSFHEYKYLCNFINDLKLNNKLNLIIEHIKNQKINSSRQKGQLFYEIINNYKFFFPIPIINNLNDIDINDNFIFISRNDIEHNKFLNNYFNINLDKNKDMIIKINNNIYIIEAKSINENGGSQNLQFKDLENNSKIILKIKKNNNEYIIKGLGILYGKCLFYKNKYSIEASKNNNIISLAEFIYKFSNYFFK